MAEAKRSKKNNFVTSKPVFTWQSPEFISIKRDIKWTIAVLAIALVLAAILFTQKQWTGVGMVLVASIFFVAISNTKPKNIGCAVYNEGIVVNGRVYNYDQFKSFWLVNSQLPKIQFQLTGRFGGVISMPLDDMDSDQIRLFISKYVPEEDEKQEDVGDIINRLFRL